jgi:putative phosphoesterase
MRIALISDIHGNLTALETALSNIAREGADKIVCLGDVALEGPQPVGVIHRLRALSIPVVKGNTDDWLLNPKPKKAKDEDERRKMEMGLWTLEQMTATERALLENYAMTLSFDLDGLSLLCYHGSPRSCEHRIRPITPAKQLEKHFRGHSETLLAGGHTHEAMVRRFGESLILNPGSVGAPVIESKTSSKDMYQPSWAEYALVESDGRDLNITLRRVPYPLADLAAAVHASGMPHTDYYLNAWRDVSDL